MNRFFPLVLIFIFASLAIFGALIINDSNGQIHKSCLVALAAGRDCPNNNILSYLAFHLNALKNFSETILNSNFPSVVFLFVILLILKIGFLLGRNILLETQLPNLNRKLRLQSAKISSSSASLKRWHSLHENSPSAFPGR